MTPKKARPNPPVTQTETPSEPPQPPEIKRVGQFYPAQIVGVLLLIAIPALAIFGLFGEQVNTANASAPGVFVEVRYITRTRFSLTTALEIVIENRTASPLTGVTVSINRAYLDAFVSSQFNPLISRVLPDAVEIDLPDLPPNAWRAIDAQMSARVIGAHGGQITIRDDQGDEARVHIETQVLP